MGPGLVLLKTAYGGHLGFPEGLNFPYLGTSWIDTIAVEWFKSFVEDAAVADIEDEGLSKRKLSTGVATPP